MPKNHEFSILDKSAIWPILMICKLDKVSIRFFVTNPRYQTNKPRIRQKIAFFEVKCRFEAFSHKAKNPFFVEYQSCRLPWPPMTDWWHTFQSENPIFFIFMGFWWFIMGLGCPKFFLGEFGTFLKNKKNFKKFSP